MTKKKKNKKQRKAQSGSLKKWLYKVTLFGLGALSGMTIPWFLYINYVTESIIDERWEVPSLVYARPLELYQGRHISVDALQFELDLLGYQQVTSSPKIGQYQLYGSDYDIMTKGFVFADKKTQAKRVKLTINKGQIADIHPQLVRLEPKIISQFYTSAFESRHPIKLEQVPNTLVQGIQAIEDREFKHHHGVHWGGIIRAAVKNIMAGKIVQGGSTITQQLVKNKLRYDHQSWLRKLHEALAATLLENKLSKKQILEMYFNEVFWGQEGKVAIHGIVDAARFYFAKSVEQLNITEQAMLIGLLKGPSWYNPSRNPKRAINRRNVVLNVWYETGVIDQNQWQNAKNEPLIALQHHKLKTDYDEYISVVKQQIKSQFSDRDLRHKGLRIFTNLDPYIQHKTNQTARRTHQWLDSNMESAIVVSDAQNGELLAISGSQSAHSGFNRALLARRAVGSLIKPFVYLAALDQLPDFTMASKLQDEAIRLTLDDGSYWQPKNWDNQSLGEITAKDALVFSRNQATVDLGLKIGVSKLVDFLERLGLKINRANHPSLFLGAIELTPFDVQHLFTLLSSIGQANQINAIRHVTDADNNMLSRARTAFNSSLKTPDIDQINQAMHQITTEGTAKKLTQKYGLKGTLYGKTGTTNEGRDSWFAGFNERYLATIWVGRDDNRPTPYSGSSGAMVLWAHLMLNIY